MNNQVNALMAMLRQDPSAYIQKCFHEINPGIPYLHNWHIDAIAHQLARCLRGEVKRLIITMPPRSLKSLCASIALPSWILGLRPECRVICVSYAQELAAQFSRDCRRVMTAPWYDATFPVTRLIRSTEDHLQTSRGGGRIATSVGGILTGRGGDFIIIDDPIKPQDGQSETQRRAAAEWYRGTLLSRLDDKRTGVIILVMQRVHMDDLAGSLIGTGDWEHLNLPAFAEQEECIALGNGRHTMRHRDDVLHPEREPREHLEQMRRAMGHYHFSAQYQQRPVPVEGNIVKREWFPLLDTMPEPTPGDGIYQSWDMAMAANELNSYSVCTTWLVQNGKYYLLDVYREQVDFPTLLDRVMSLAQHWRAQRVLIERTASGIPILQTLQKSKEPYFRPYGVQPQGDKVTRLTAHTHTLEQGRVILPRYAPWLDTFLEEMLAFPNGKHDDQVDSVSQFLHWHANRNSVQVKKLIFAV